MAKPTISQDDLKSILRYNELTGDLVWSVSTGSVSKGKIAGHIDTRKYGNSYLIVRISGVAYCAHRLIWLYVYGELPNGEIDHIDGNSLNNKLDNLRAVTHHNNCKNVKIRSDNKSGVHGVYFNKLTNKWISSIGITENKKRRTEYHGSYVDKWDAICSRKSAENKHSFHINHGVR